jgi:hypothetical protein
VSILSQSSIKKPRGPANSTGYPGVRHHRPKDAAHRWIACVTIDGKAKQVPGRYDTAAEASAARTAFIAKLEAEKSATATNGEGA